MKYLRGFLLLLPLCVSTVQADVWDDVKKLKRQGYQFATQIQQLQQQVQVLQQQVQVLQQQANRPATPAPLPLPPPPQNLLPKGWTCLINDPVVGSIFRKGPTQAVARTLVINECRERRGACPPVQIQCNPNP